MKYRVVLASPTVCYRCGGNLFECVQVWAVFDEVIDEHKSAIDLIQEFDWAKPFIKCDADFRSLCSQGFAHAFKSANP